jgi:transposase
MPAPLPIKFRQRIVRAYNQGEGSFATLGKRFGVSHRTVERLVGAQRRGESLHPSKPTGAPRKLTEDDMQWLKQQLVQDPYLTSYALAHRFNKTHRRRRVHRSTILRAMHGLGYSYKKNTRRSATQPSQSSKGTR